MHHHTKIATCCYCGIRAALVLKGRERHELACSGCGAPLHELKSMPLTPVRNSSPKVAAATYDPRSQKKKKKAKKSKRRSALGYFAREAFDLIEDIFD